MPKIQTSLTLPDYTKSRLEEIATANGLTLSALVGELLTVAVALGPMSFTRVAPDHNEYVLQLGEITLGYKWDADAGVFYPVVIYHSTPMLRGSLVPPTPLQTTTL